jgi:hypothetical protein
MRQFFRTVFTGTDNQSYDIARVVWGISALAFLSFEAFVIFRGAPFNPMEFAGALSALSIGHGATLKIKSETEPQVSEAK